MSQKWVEWSQRIQAICQTGLTYANSEFDKERYKQLRDLAAEIVTSYSNHTYEEIIDYFNKEDGYATPKIDVRGVVFKENKILLVKEKSDGLWALPGGWADVGDSPGENVIKEIFEESGYKTIVKRLLALYDRRKQNHQPEIPYHVYKIFFLCEIVGGNAKTSLETSEVKFFELGKWPELSTGRVTEKQLYKMYELKEKDRVDFD